MRALLIEDDIQSAAVLELMLARSQVNVSVAHTGQEGLDCARHYDFDIILLDLGLPDMSGHVVIRDLRRMGKECPVLVLSSNELTQSKLDAFSAGADDYLTKPYRREEVVARMQAIVRRARGFAQAAIPMGPMTLNLDSKTIDVHGTTVPLTTKEYSIVELLALRQGKTLSKDAILDHIYGGMDEPDPKIIDVFVCKIRKKIAELTGGQNFIETIWGRGYVLRVPTGGRKKGMMDQAA